MLLTKKPTETNFFSSEKDGRSLRFSESSRMPVNGYYSFSDGYDFFLNLGKYAGDNFYYKAETVGPEYLVFILNRDKELFVRIALIVFGVAGGLIADSTMSDFIPVLIHR